MLDVGALINAVKKRPVLYNRYDQNRSNRSFVSNTWAELAEELGVNEIEARRKWSVLRDTFRKQVKHEFNVKPGLRRKPSRRWYLFNKMRFLLPSTQSSLKENSFNDDGEASSNKDLAEELNEEYEEEGVEEEDGGGNPVSYIKQEKETTYNITNAHSQHSPKGCKPNAISTSAADVSPPMANHTLPDDSYSEPYLNNVPHASAHLPNYSNATNRKRAREMLQQGSPSDTFSSFHAFRDEMRQSIRQLQEKVSAPKCPDDDDELFLRSLLPLLKLLDPITKLECRGDLNTTVLKYLKRTQSQSHSQRQDCFYHVTVRSPSPNANSEQP